MDRRRTGLLHRCPEVLLCHLHNVLKSLGHVTHDPEGVRELGTEVKAEVLVLGTVK